MVNSIFELMKLRIYMKKDIIIKCGSYGMSMYLFLDGEALMYGIDNELIHIMTSGTHFNNEIDDLEDFSGKRICNVIAKTITTVGVIEREQLRTLFEAFPYWKKIIHRLNRKLYNRCKIHLKKYLEAKQIEPSYKNAFEEVERVSILDPMSNPPFSISLTVWIPCMMK